MIASLPVDIQLLIVHVHDANFKPKLFAALQLFNLRGFLQNICALMTENTFQCKDNTCYQRFTNEVCAFRLNNEHEIFIMYFHGVYSIPLYKNITLNLYI